MEVKKSTKPGAMILIQCLALAIALVAPVLTDKESVEGETLYKRVFASDVEGPIDQRRIDALTDEQKKLLISRFHSNLEASRNRGSQETDLISSPIASNLARLDDEWGIEAFASDFRSGPRANWDYRFKFVRNARVIPLIGDLLFKEEKYEMPDDLGIPPTQWTATEGVIQILKYSPQFLPDIGIWGRQLEDSLTQAGDNPVNILRDWYRENEGKLKEGKFLEIRPGRTPVVKVAASSETPVSTVVADQAGTKSEVDERALMPPPSAMWRKSPELPAWVLWSAGVCFIVFALGLLVRWMRQRS